MRPAHPAFAFVCALTSMLCSGVVLADEPSEPSAPLDPGAEQGPALPPLPVRPSEEEAVRRPRRTSPPDWGAMTDAPTRLPYREGKATPPGYEVDTVPRNGMIIGGALMAGGLHLVSMIAAVALDAEADEVIKDEQGGSRTDPEFDNRYTPLFIPLVGPFVAVKTADATGTGMALLVMNGIAQVTGCSLVIAGLASPKKVLVKQDAVVGMEVVPLLSKDVAGMVFEGKF